MAKIALFGGSGFLGRHLRDRFAEDGHSVQIFTTQETNAHGFVQYNENIEGDWVASLQGSKVIINLAGEPIAQRWTTQAREDIEHSRVRATKLIGQVLSNLEIKPSFWVNLSASGYYGDRADEVLTESSPPGSGFLPTVCQAWEAAAVEACPAGVHLSLARCGLVLGNGGGVWPLFVNLSKYGLLGGFGDGKSFVPWIHVQDFVEAIHWVLSEKLEGPINICTPAPMANFGFYGGISDGLHRFLALHAPNSLLNLARKMDYPVPLVADSQRMVPEKLLKSGFEFQMPDLSSALERLKPPAKVK